MPDADFTVIGAGVVGLAIAQSITEQYKNVFVVEKHLSFGQETSSRNSEVIHAGIYYPGGSLKARLCVEGKQMLYDFCRKHDVPCRNCGKLIVATSAEEIPVIRDIKKTAEGNGVNDLQVLDRSEVASLEPEVYALEALFSPTTGIVDSHSLMKQYETNTLNNGGQIVYGSEVTGIERLDKCYLVRLRDSDGREYNYTSAYVINSAGLYADRISEMAGIKDEKLRIYFCKGEYFRIKPPKNRLVSRLVYPVPHPNMEGIGIHVTVDMAGGVKLGPDVRYLDSNVQDYRLTASKQEDFFKSAKRFLPFLDLDDIVPEMAGIRPKIQKPGDPQQDFYIAEETKRGFPRFINLVGMESPGLTASLSIAKYVNELINNPV